MRKYQTPVAIIVLGVVIVAVHLIAEAHSYYWRYLWLDIPMHFFGGLWVALMALWFFLRSGYIQLEKPTRGRDVFVIALLATLLVGLMWEVFEFSVDTVFAIGEQNDRADTLLDLFMDVLGAFAAMGLYFYKHNRNTHG